MSISFLPGQRELLRQFNARSPLVFSLDMEAATDLVNLFVLGETSVGTTNLISMEEPVRILN